MAQVPESLTDYLNRRRLEDEHRYDSIEGVTPPRQPRWLERMQQGQTKGKDMTGWRPDGDAA